MTSLGGVYFIQGGDLVKIGVSVNVLSRLGGLQTGSPVALRLLGFIENANEGVERCLHSHFHRQRSHGEWFHPSDELLAVAHGDYSVVPSLKAQDVATVLGVGSAYVYSELQDIAWPAGRRGGPLWVPRDIEEVAQAVTTERVAVAVKRALRHAFTEAEQHAVAACGQTVRPSADPRTPA